MSNNKKKPHVLYGYAELETLINNFNRKGIFLDIYEKNIYYISSDLKVSGLYLKIIDKIKKFNNIALVKHVQEGQMLLIIEIGIIFMDIEDIMNSNDVIFDEKSELFYNYNLKEPITSLHHLSKITKSSYSSIFEDIVKLKVKILEGGKV